MKLAGFLEKFRPRWVPACQQCPACRGMVEGPDVVDRATSTQKKPLGCMLRINVPPISARSVHTGPIKPEIHHTSGTQPSPKSPKPASRGKSRRREAKVVRIRHRTEDSFATGDGSVIAYDPVSLAL